MTSGNAANRYLRMVKKNLICPKETRSHLLETARQAVNACLEDEPGTTYLGLVHAIGDPEVFANDLLAIVPAEVVENTRRKGRFQLCAAIVTLAIVITTALVVMGSLYLKYQEALREGLYGEETLIICPDDMTTKEFKEYLNQTTGSKWETN